MGARGLPMRILYAMLAGPSACIAGFYVAVLLLTRVCPHLEHVQSPDPGWPEFVQSLLIGSAAGLTIFFYALTLPGWRRRQRAGRTLRLAISALVVLLVSIICQAEAVPLQFTIGLMIWLSLTLTFTVIRYGVLDSSRRRRTVLRRLPED